AEIHLRALEEAFRVPRATRKPGGEGRRDECDHYGNAGGGLCDLPTIPLFRKKRSERRRREQGYADVDDLEVPRSFRADQRESEKRADGIEAAAKHERKETFLALPKNDRNAGDRD